MKLWIARSVARVIQALGIRAQSRNLELVKDGSPFFTSRTHVCHPERKRGPPIAVDQTSPSRVIHSALVRSFVVFATRDDVPRGRGVRLEKMNCEFAPKKTLPTPGRDRTDRCLCAFRDRSRRRCNVRPMIRWQESRRCGVRDFFETPASDNPTN